LFIIYFAIKLEGTDRSYPSDGSPVWILSVFLVPRCSSSWGVHYI